MSTPPPRCGPQGPAEAPSRQWKGTSTPASGPTVETRLRRTEGLFLADLALYSWSATALWFKEVLELFRNSSMTSDCKNVSSEEELHHQPDCLLLSRTAIWLFYSVRCKTKLSIYGSQIRKRAVKSHGWISAGHTGLKQQHFFTVIMCCTDPELNSFISVWNTASEPVYNQCAFLSHWVSLRMRRRSHPSAELNLW